MLIGVHGDNRPLWPESAFRRLTLARPDLVKMMTCNDLAMFWRVKALLHAAKVITRLFWLGKPPAPEAFVEAVSPAVAGICELGYETFELLNEPNAPWEGFGPSGAEEFDHWALEAIPMLRRRFPGIRLLWPGLAVNPEFNDEAWWRICQRSVAACDGLAGHGFWQPDWAMEDRQWGLRFLVGREMYPDKEIWVTEAGCTDPSVSKHHRAELYPRYCEILRGLGVKGVAFWLLEGTEEWEREQNAFFDEEMAEALGRVPRGRTARIGGLEVADLRSSLKGSGYPARELSAINYLVIHHSGVDRDSTAEAIAAYHVDSLGWPGIGYHFLVHQDGRVEYVGDIATVRYNVAGRNHEVIGICLPGDFTSHRPTEVALSSTGELIANLRIVLGRPLPVVGHRDIAFSPTACPGDTWPQWGGKLEEVGSLREALERERAFSGELVRLLATISDVAQEFQELLGKRG